VVPNTREVTDWRMESEVCPRQKCETLLEQYLKSKKIPKSPEFKPPILQKQKIAGRKVITKIIRQFMIRHF
jgi:hypothetical protein